VWLDVKEDDRSDDDECEFREEMKEEAERVAMEEELVILEERKRVEEMRVGFGGAMDGKTRTRYAKYGVC
jgi:hypothetical protein